MGTHRTAVVSSCLTLALTLPALGCAGDEDAATASPATTVAAGAAPTMPLAADGGGGAEVLPAVVGPVPVAAADRLVAVVVTAQVEVDDVGEAARRVVDVAARRGGRVDGTDLRLADERAAARLVLLLPPDQLEGAIDELAAMGRLVGRQQATEDVTEQVADVEARLRTARESVERVQRLLAEADDLGEVVLIEGELTSRQAALESLLAQQQALASRVAMSTLTVDLLPRAVASVAGGTDRPSVGSAFAGGGRAFVDAVGWTLVVFGYTAPFLGVAALVAAVWVLSRRPAGRRSRSAAPPIPPAPAAGP